MKALHRICAVLALVGVGTFAVAQDQTVVLPSPIMVVDFERVFVETLYGQRIARGIAAERELVQADNDRIAAELLSEETDLTQARGTMDPAAFRDAARAFSERAQSVRQDREEEQVKLLQLRDTERAQFLERIRPIILALMLERGAVVAMDRRAVLQAIGSANATADAVSLIDETLGDGTRDPSDRPTLRPSLDDEFPVSEPFIIGEERDVLGSDDALVLPDEAPEDVALEDDDLSQSQ